MSELATLARPYAEAAFKRAKETNTLSQWSESLAFLAAVVEDKAISAIVDNPEIAKDRLTALMLDICQGHLDKESENFLKTLIQYHRLALAPAIAGMYEQYKAEYEGYVAVEVTSAFAFSQEEQKKFAATLEKTLNKKVHMAVTVDKSLLGGVLVRAGDRVFDGSIRGQLQQLAKRL